MEMIKLEDNITKLKNVYKMSDDLINKILYKNETVYPYHPIDISTFLVHIDDIDDTQRICSIIDSLNRNIGISYETLAVFCEIKTKELEEFLRNPESLTEKKKFVLAVRTMFMHFVMKEKYTVDTISD
jgi:helix-turn-helix protein